MQKLSIDLLDKIGEGPWTTVYKAWDNGPLQREVAVKVLLESHSHQKYKREQFYERVRAMADVRHERLLPVFNTLEEQDWVVVELADESAASKIASERTPISEAKSYLAQGLQALSVLHAHGRIHGQIKPTNLLLYADGRLKVSDPGVIIDGMLPLTDGVGKYLAPELVEPEKFATGSGLGSQLDLYQLGFCILEMIAGAQFDSCFPGMTAGGADQASMWWRFHGSTEEFSGLIKKLIPSGESQFQSVMESLLRKAPNQRPSSAIQVLQSLGTAVIPEKVREVAGPTRVPVVNTLEQVADPDVQMIRMKPVSSMPQPKEIPQAPAKPFLVPPNGKTSQSFLADRKKVLMAAILIVLLSIVMTAVRIGGTEQPLIIQVDSVPPGATIVLNDKSQPIKTPQPIEFSRTTAYEVSVVMDGYESPVPVKLSPDGDLPKDNRIVFQLHQIQVTAAITPPVSPINSTTDPMPSQPTPPPRMTHWKLPSGLEPDGMAIDESTGLPLQTTAVKLNAFYQDGDVPLSFVLVPSGEFQFGAIPPLHPGEIAARKVTIPTPFYIAVNELTIGQRAAALDDGSASTQLETRTRNHPAVMMSYTDALQYCTWLGAEFELPSEEQWEWAARGTHEWEFPWGGESPARPHANIAFTQESDMARQLQSVEDLAAGRTPAGVSHLLGNAAEWCRDFYTPGDGEDLQTTGVGTLHVIRGGSFRSPQSMPVHITWRANAQDRGHADIGVRIICRPLPPEETQP